jgi:hypothetical protein
MYIRCERLVMHELHTIHIRTSMPLKLTLSWWYINTLHHVILLKLMQILGKTSNLVEILSDYTKNWLRVHPDGDSLTVEICRSIKEWMQGHGKRKPGLFKPIIQKPLHISKWFKFWNAAKERWAAKQKSSGRPDTSEGDVERITQFCVRSRKKWIARRGLKFGIPKTTIQNAFHKPTRFRWSMKLNLMTGPTVMILSD